MKIRGKFAALWHRLSSSLIVPRALNSRPFRFAQSRRPFFFACGALFIDPHHNHCSDCSACDLNTDAHRASLEDHQIQVSQYVLYANETHLVFTMHFMTLQNSPSCLPKVHLYAEGLRASADPRSEPSLSSAHPVA